MLTVYPGQNRAGPINPICEVGQNVLLVDRQKYRLYQVANIEPLTPGFPLITNVAAQSINPNNPNIAAGATVGPFNPFLYVDVPYGTLAQIRIRPMSDINIRISQPQAVQRMTTQNSQTAISPLYALRDPYDALAEFFVLEQDHFFITVSNPQGVTIARALVMFYGFKYILLGKNDTGGDGGAVTAHLPPIAEFDRIDQAVASGYRFTVVPTGGWGA